jgi:bifunctional NMN adenylyltransferase/nudix hydrolase
MKYALFIGRFQPFHLGHKYIINESLKQFDKVIVGIGSSNSPRTIKNPFTYNEHIHIITSTINSDKLLFIDVDDDLYNDMGWINNIKTKIKHIIKQGDTVTLVGHSKDKSSYYLKIFPEYNNLELSNWENIDATTIREQWFTNGCTWHELVPTEVSDMFEQFSLTQEFYELKKEYNFIKKYKKAWETAPYPPTFVTTDAVVIISNYVLLVKRKANPGKGLLALPGGFLNQDETVEQCVIRELLEETKIKVPIQVLKGSIVTSKVFDYPQRSLRGRTITHAFLFNLRNELELPKVKGSDDAASAQWVRINELSPLDMFEDHYFIIKKLINYV